MVCEFVFFKVFEATISGFVLALGFCSNSLDSNVQHPGPPTCTAFHVASTCLFIITQIASSCTEAWNCLSA